MARKVTYVSIELPALLGPIGRDFSHFRVYRSIGILNAIYLRP